MNIFELFLSLVFKTNLIQYLIHLGIPSLGMPELDPLKFDYFENKLNQGIITGQAKGRNVKIYGLSKQKFQSVSVQFSDDQIQVDIKVTAPKLVSEGNYQFNGFIRDPILNLKVGGKGI